MSVTTTDGEDWLQCFVRSSAIWPPRTLERGDVVTCAGITSAADLTQRLGTERETPCKWRGGRIWWGILTVVDRFLEIGRRGPHGAWYAAGTDNPTPKRRRLAWRPRQAQGGDGQPSSVTGLRIGRYRGDWTGKGRAGGLCARICPRIAGLREELGEGRAWGQGRPTMMSGRRGRGRRVGASCRHDCEGTSGPGKKNGGIGLSQERVMSSRAGRKND